MTKTRLLKILLFTAGLCQIIYSLTVLLTVKEYPTESNINKLIHPWLLSEKQDGFYSERKNSLDVVFLGSSNTYCGINPNVIWNEYGITSYDFAGDQQELGTTYYYLKQVFETQSPKVVVIDILNSGEEESISVLQAHFSFDHMKNDIHKIQAILERLKQDRLEMFFPIITYHSRWKELNQNDISYRPDQHNLLNGAFLSMLQKQYDPPQISEEVPEITLSDRTIRWLDSIRKLCREHDCECVFIKTPIATFGEFNSYIEAVETYCAGHDVPFLYLNKNADEIGIDFGTDFFDDIHLNWYGQQKLSLYLGKYLQDRFHIENKKGLPGYAQWDQDYNDMMYYLENYPILNPDHEA